MCEISALDHLVTKVNTLFQKIDKLIVSVVTPPSVSPPCEICGIAGHTDTIVFTIILLNIKTLALYWLCIINIMGMLTYFLAALVISFIFSVKSKLKTCQNNNYIIIM